ncbi:hypothetical protein V3F56_05550 [Moorellaceae bacterium AZ2]
MAVGRHPIGFVALGNRYNFNNQLAEQLAFKARMLLQNIADDQIVGTTKLVTDIDTADHVANMLQSERVERLVIFSGTFGSGQILMKIIGDFKGPVLLWALPEPPNTCKVELNSLCGVNLYSSLMAAMDLRYTYIYCHPEDEGCIQELSRWVRVSHLLLTLRRMRIALLGHHTPGFDTFGLNELSIRRELGPEILHIDLSELFQEAENLPEAQWQAVVSELAPKVANWEEVPETKRQKYARTCKAFENLRERYSLDAVAVKCWPEFIVGYGQAVCATLSKMVDGGFMAGCEGDVLGTITSFIQFKLSGQVPFIADLISVDKGENTGTFWHCGCAPFSLAASGYPICLGEEFGGAGLNLEFPLKPGKVTIARLSYFKGRYRLLIAKGDMLPPKSLDGTGGTVKMECSVEKFLDTIIYGGFEHHLGIAYGDIVKDLQELGRLLDIETTVL